jgi:transcription initiation factor TFIIIB Brf1 subunit/transcription initiation factor TFIIB
MSDTLPFETAPELVDEVCNELSTCASAKQRARERASQFSGIDPDYILSRTPRSIAAACIYIESRGSETEHTQSEIAHSAGISPVALRQTRDDISETLPESHPCKQVKK